MLHPWHSPVLDASRLRSRAIAPVRISRTRIRTPIGALVASLSVHNDEVLVEEPTQEAHELPADSSEKLEPVAGVSSELSSRVLGSNPALAALQAEYLDSRLDELEQVFQCSSNQALVLLNKQPLLLEKPPSWAMSFLMEMAASMGADIQNVAAAVRKVPSLLAHHPTELTARMREIASALHTDVDTASRLALKEPGMLCMERDIVMSKLKDLAEAFPELGGAEGAAGLVCRNPHLLRMSVTTITQKVAVLSQGLHMSLEDVRSMVLEKPLLLEYSATNLVQKAQGMRKGPISPQTWRALTKKDASLLRCSRSSAIGSLQVIKDLTGLDHKDALELAFRRPSLLSKSTTALNRSYRALSVWRFSVEEKQELVQAHPLLLCLSATEVHERCRWLRSLMMSNGFYHVGMRRLGIAGIGVLIMHLPLAWSRLQFLAETNQEASMPFMDVISCSRSKFKSRFPEHEKWFQWKSLDMGGPVPWRTAKWRESSGAKRSKERAAGASAPASASSNAASGSVAGSNDASPSSSETQRAGTSPSAKAAAQRSFQAAGPTSRQEYRSRGGFSQGERSRASNGHPFQQLQRDDGSGPSSSSEQTVQKSEARAWYVGTHYVRKPKRVYVATEAESEEHAGAQPGHSQLAAQNVSPVPSLEESSTSTSSPDNQVEQKAVDDSQKDGGLAV